MEIQGGRSPFHHAGLDGARSGWSLPDQILASPRRAPATCRLSISPLLDELRRGRRSGTAFAITGEANIRPPSPQHDSERDTEPGEEGMDQRTAPDSRDGPSTSLIFPTYNPGPL